MDKLAASDVIMMDIIIYAFVSLVLFQLMDFYAKKKLGGKNTTGFKALRFPKWLSLMIVSLFSIGIVVAARFGFTVRASTLTYFGIPYFVMWFYFLVSVLRRIRSETRGK
jgi:hypothetical protein